MILSAYGIGLCTLFCEMKKASIPKSLIFRLNRILINKSDCIPWILLLNTKVSLSDYFQL